MFSMNRFEGTSAMQTPFPPANATPGAHPASSLSISLEINPLQAWSRVPFSPRSATGVKAALLRVLRPAVTGRRASSVERGSSSNEVDSGLAMVFPGRMISWNLV